LLIILKEGGLIMGDKDKAFSSIMMAQGGRNLGGIIGTTSGSGKGEGKGVFSAVEMET
jgi:hypothetical protein